MRRFLAVFLAVFITILQGALICSPAIAAEEERSGEALAFLKALGVVPWDGDILDADITNEDFAAALGVAGGFIKDYYEEILPGLADGSEFMLQSTSNPKGNITYSQGAKAVVSVLGYAVHAVNKGGYPGGYLYQARQLGLDVGCPADTNLTYGDVCILLQKALHTRVLEVAVYSDINRYEQRGTLFYETFKIIKSRGQVTANAFSSLSEGRDYNAGRIEIGGTVYKSSIDYDSLLGYNVDFYYEEDEDRLVYACPVKNDLPVVYENNEVSSEGGNVVKVKRKNGSFYNFTVSDGYCLIYNNVASTKTLALALNTMDGRAEFYDSDNDGKYDLVKVYDYTSIFAGTVSQREHLIIDKYNSQKKLYMDPAVIGSAYFIYDAEGYLIDLKDISEFDVVSALISDDGKTVVAHVSKQTASGVVMEISISDEDDGIITLDETNYMARKSFRPRIEHVELGVNAVLCLDIFGKVCGLRIGSDAFELAMIIDVNEHKGLSEPVKLKLYTSAGRSEVFNLADKVTIDGLVCRDMDTGYAELYDSGELKSRLIRYKSNTAGEITEIDTAYYAAGREPEASLRVTYERAQMMYGKSASVFGGRFVTDGGTKFFTMNTDEPNEEEGYSTLQNGFFNDWGTYEVEGYSIDEYKLKTSYVVCFFNKSNDGELRGSSSSFMYVTHFAQALLPDGTIGTNMHGIDLIGNRAVTVPVKDRTAADDIGRGAVIMYGLTIRGELGLYTVAYRDPTRTMAVANPTSTTLSVGRWMKGRVLKRGDNFMEIVTNDAASLDNPPLADCITLSLIGGTATTAYLSDAGSSDIRRVVKCDFKDIKDYIRSAGDCDTVLVYSQVGRMHFAIVL